MVVVSGTRFESLFIFIFFARTFFLHVLHESEGTACVVVVSGTRFESLFIYLFCTYGHALVLINGNVCVCVCAFSITPKP